MYRDLDSELNLGFEIGVELNEGIVGGGVGIAQLFNVIFFIFLADGIDPEQNVDDAHFGQRGG